MSTMAPRIALLVDQPQRDLGGLVITADALCRRGAVCYLVPANLRHRELFALAPDLVLFYNLRRGYERLAQQLVDAGIQFGLLDAEGGVWQNLGAYTELLWEDRALLHAASVVCAWGPRMAAHLVGEGYFRREQVVVTGCPRFDLYHPSWRGARTNGSGARGHILVNTNFADANPRFSTPERMRDFYRDTFAWPVDRIDEWFALQAQGIDAMIALTRTIACAHPDRSVVVRPHPFEGIDWYRRGLDGVPNVELNTTGPVQPQINGAAVVIQRSCTTAIEAGLAGVPTLSPQWVPTPAIMPMAEAVSVPCADEGALHAQLDAVLAGAYHVPETTHAEIDDVIREWFHCVDGEAHERVAAAVMAAVSEHRTVRYAACKQHLHGVGAEGEGEGEGLGGLGRQLRYRLGLSPEWSFRHFREVPTAGFAGTDQAYDFHDVEHTLAQIAERDRGAGRQVTPPISAARARDAGEYVHRYAGQAVVLARRPPSGGSTETIT